MTGSTGTPTPPSPTPPSPPPPSSPPFATGRPPLRLVTIVVYTLRSCIGPKRWLGSLLPCAGALLFGLLAHAMTEAPGEAFARVAADGIFALVVPIASLVIGDAVLGAEVRSGVFHFTWLTPTPLTQIVVGRWLGGCIVAVATIVPACALAAIIAGDAADAGAAALAAFAGAVAYIAIFVAIGCVARRAAVWSLAFVFLVERLLGTALTDQHRPHRHSGGWGGHRAAGCHHPDRAGDRPMAARAHALVRRGGLTRPRLRPPYDRESWPRRHRHRHPTRTR